MILLSAIGTQESFEALGRFLYYEVLQLKEYKTNEELIELLISKGVSVVGGINHLTSCHVFFDGSVDCDWK